MSSAVAKEHPDAELSAQAAGLRAKIQEMEAELEVIDEGRQRGELLLDKQRQRNTLLTKYFWLKMAVEMAPPVQMMSRCGPQTSTLSSDMMAGYIHIPK